MSKILRGFTIRTHQAEDSDYADQKQNVCAEKGSAPAEWHQVKENPQIDQAELYSSAQRHVRGDRRRYLDTKGT